MNPKDLEIKIKELKKALNSKQQSQTLDPDMLERSKKQMEIELKKLEDELNRSKK